MRDNAVSPEAKLTQVQMDIATVQGWRDAARAAQEPFMVALYERLLAALRAVTP